MRWSHRAAFLLLLLGLLNPVFADISSSHQAGKTWGQKEAKHAYQHIRNFSSHDLLAPELQGETFDPQKAKEQVKQNTVPQSEAVDFVRSEAVLNNREQIDGHEYFLERSEHIASEEDQILEPSKYTLETCQHSDAPYPISLTRTLHVEVTHDPGIIREVKNCLGHFREEKFSKKSSASDTAKKWRQEFEEDPSIKQFDVKVIKTNILHKHILRATWTHHDDANQCDRFQNTQQVLSEPKWEEVSDRWIYDEKETHSLSKTPHCTFFEKTCLDTTPSKEINGKEVQRQCWKERLTFLCRLPKTEGCPYFKDKNCDLIKKECLEEGPYGCSLWKLIFKCYSGFHEKERGEIEVFGLNEEAPEYELNDSFSEVISKLSVFEEMKHDLQDSESENIQHIQVFKGKPMKCSKSITDDLMYDCCFTYAGLAKKLKLAQCNEEELALAEMREAGLCHYVGSYSGKFHDLWKSRDEHVFCCFKTKLARVLQEQGRAQLNLSWGDPETTNCNGLTVDQISSLNFSKMDFSELYENFEGKLPENFQEKLGSFQKRVERKMLEESV